MFYLKYILSITCFYFLHDIPVSFFDFYLEESKFSIEIESHSLNRISENTDEKLVIKDLNNYLLKNMILSADDEVCSLRITNFEKLKNGHSIINGTIDCEMYDLESVKIETIWFLELFEHQINSINIHQKNKKIRGFKMDIDRTKIEVIL